MREITLELRSCGIERFIKASSTKEIRLALGLRRDLLKLQDNFFERLEIVDSFN